MIWVLIETVLLSTHNISFSWEIRKLIFWYALLTKGLWLIIAPSIGIPMDTLKYLAMHKVQIHTGAISKLLYGSESVWGIIH